MRRRDLLRVATTGAVLGVAGCSGGGDGESTTTWEPDLVAREPETISAAEGGRSLSEFHFHSAPGAEIRFQLDPVEDGPAPRRYFVFGIHLPSGGTFVHERHVDEDGPALPRTISTTLPSEGGHDFHRYGFIVGVFDGACELSTDQQGGEDSGTPNVGEVVETDAFDGSWATFEDRLTAFEPIDVEAAYTSDGQFHRVTDPSAATRERAEREVAVARTLGSPFLPLSFLSLAWVNDHAAGLTMDDALDYRDLAGAWSTNAEQLAHDVAVTNGWRAVLDGGRLAGIADDLAEEIESETGVTVDEDDLEGPLETVLRPVFERNPVEDSDEGAMYSRTWLRGGLTVADRSLAVAVPADFEVTNTRTPFLETELVADDSDLELDEMTVTWG